MQVFAVDLYIGRPIGVDVQFCLFFSFLVEHFFNVIVAVACDIPQNRDTKLASSLCLKMSSRDEKKDTRSERVTTSRSPPLK
jgi:hypothetical protein